MLENSLIIFSSDNGLVLDDGYKDQAKELAGNHDPKGGLRGGKYNLFDGGTHIPLFVYLKGEIQPTQSDALVCQMDLAASIGALTGGKVPEGLSSKNYINTFLEKTRKGAKNLY